MLALVVAPAALLTLMLAWSLFGSALANLQTTQAAAAIGRAATIRAWLDAEGRSLANESGAALLLAPERCSQLAKAFLDSNPGFVSLRLLDKDGAPCEAGAPLDGAAPDAGPAGEDVNYGLAAVAGRLWIVSGPRERRSVLVVDDAALRARLHLAVNIGELHLAVIGPGAAPIAQDHEADARWLPAKIADAKRSATFRTADVDGITAAYALAKIGGEFRVLLRFDDRLYEAAWRRFVILCVAQLSMLGLLASVYALAIRRDVVRWIEGIDVAARLRGGDPDSRAVAPVSPKMPRELRNVAESFNAMAGDAAERRVALERSLDENRVLMLEMHHRIKNSLQVIQSYLALIRRNGPRVEGPILARIEARVGVLAAAYRLALTPKGLRPIRIKPFVEETFAAVTGGLKRPRQTTRLEALWDGELIVDRAIPLGLALVEAIIAALDAPEVCMGVRLAPDETGGVVLVVEADAAPSAPALPEKVMRGLAAQLGATPAPLSGGDILRWRFVP